MPGGYCKRRRLNGDSPASINGSALYQSLPMPIVTRLPFIVQPLPDSASAGARVGHIPELLEQILLDLVGIELEATRALLLSQKKTNHTNGSSAGTRLGHQVLELILQDLFAAELKGMRTILLSQRVCKAFYNTIAGSTRLQHELHFAKTTSPSKFHPSYNNIQPQIGCGCMHDLHSPGLPVENSLLAHSLRHPISLPDGTDLEVSMRRPFNRYIGDEELQIVFNRYYCPDAETSHQRGHDLGISASWRRMRLFKETTGATEVSRVACRGIKALEVVGSWMNPTLGEMYDLMYE